MTLESLYFWLTVFTILVIVGVVLEGEELLAELQTSGWMHVEHKAAKIGFALLVIGLAGELFFQTKIESADAELKRQSDTNIAEAQKEAARASERAADANERSKVLENDAAKLKAANLALEKQISPRDLSPDQRVNIGKSIEGFSGKKVTVTSYASDVESLRLGKEIIESLNKGRIAVVPNLASQVVFGGLNAGIMIRGEEADRDFIEALARALIYEGRLREVKYPPFDTEYDPTGEGGGVILEIGVKPIEEP
jgi:hypothetical protein